MENSVTGTEFRLQCEEGYSASQATGNMVCSNMNMWQNIPRCNGKMGCLYHILILEKHSAKEQPCNTPEGSSALIESNLTNKDYFGFYCKPGH